MNPRAFIFAIAALSLSAAFGKENLESSVATGALQPAQKLIDDLLDYSAPPPDWREYLRAHPRSAQPPDSTGSIAALLNYWSQAPTEAKPEQHTQLRLLEIIEQQPASADALLRWLPTEAPEVHERIKAVEERVSHQKNIESESTHTVLRDWLMEHSQYFRDELKRRALLPDDVSPVKAASAEAALWKLDAEGAKRFFLEKSVNGNAQGRAISLIALRKRFSAQASAEQKDEWREGLKKIVTDPKATHEPRTNSLLDLMKEDWPGRDEWFLSLFSDKSLATLEPHVQHPAALGEVALLAPDYWIPKIVPLVNRTGFIRINAIYCLIQFQLDRARADALRPLLPWITNPKWAPDPEEYLCRLRLIQSLDRVDLPESVPALLEIAKVTTDFEMEAAADDLAHYKMREAIPSLKRAIAREKEEYHRRKIVAAISRLDGFSTAEIVEALRAYAIKSSTEAGKKDISDADDVLPKKTLRPIESIGDQFTLTEIDDPNIIKQLRKAADDLQRTNPAGADALRQITARCTAANLSEEIVRQLRAGDFTAEWAVALLDKKKSLGKPLQKVEDLHGSALGLQASIVGEPAQIAGILAGDDRFAKLCLLASSRIAKTSLPITQLEAILETSDPLAQKAAQLYLEADDSPAARAILWRRASSKPLLLGSYLGYDPGHFSYRGLTESETVLVNSLKQTNAPRKIFALLSEGYWGGAGQRILYAYPDRFQLRCDDGNGRVRTRRVAAAEANELIAWLEHTHIDDLPPFDEHTWDGVQYEYLRVQPESARRVFMNNPPFAPSSDRFQPPVEEEDRPDPAIYGELAQRFLALDQGLLDVHYPALEKMNGYRVTHVREDGEIVGFALRNGKLAASLHPGSGFSLEWHALNTTGLSKDFVREEREESPFVSPNESDNGVTLMEGVYANKKLRATWKEENRPSGLWIEDKAKNVQLIATGIFGAPVICPGGEWVVVAKTPGDAMWGVPNGVVRINLRTKKIIPVGLPAADTFDPVIWVSAQQRVLLHRARDENNSKAGPVAPEYFLLDVTTGKHERIKGEFGPCFDGTRYPLQPTDRPNEYWAVTHEEKEHTTNSILGRYDMRKFRFTEVLRFPDVNFQSHDVWIDESAKKIWIALNGDLLRFELPAGK